MRTMRGTSSTTMSHAPMRAALALSALSETPRDEPREVIESAHRVRPADVVYLFAVAHPCGDHVALALDQPICWFPARRGTDAVAGRIGIRGGGGEPGK